MSYSMHINSISNAVCGMDPSACRLDDNPERPDQSAVTFSEYISGIRNKMTIVDDVAVIPVSGVVGERLDDFDIYFGMTDFEDVRRRIAIANEDGAVNGIVLDIDSPGGYVTGCEETAQAIMDSAKPVVAFTNTMAASCAYWLAISANAFYATPSSIIGSVGVYTLFYDWSAAYQKAGITAEMFRSDGLKGIGAMGVPLTDEQRDHLQSEVDELAASFKSFVVSRRGQISDDDMRGQTKRGKKAMAANMIDRLGSLEDAVEEASDAAAIR